MKQPLKWLEEEQKLSLGAEERMVSKKKLKQPFQILK